MGQQELTDSEDEEEDKYGQGYHKDPSYKKYSRIGGGKTDYIHSFTTLSGKTAYEEINFGYFRPWESGNTFPDPSDTVNFHSIQLLVKDYIKHDIELNSISEFEEVVPDLFEV